MRWGSVISVVVVTAPVVGCGGLEKAPVPGREQCSDVVAASAVSPMPVPSPSAVALSCPSAPAVSAVPPPDAALAAPSANSPVLNHKPDELIDPSPTSDGAPAELYALLFQKGAKWKIAVRGEESRRDKDGTPKTSATTVSATCEVESSDKYDWALESEIRCTDLPRE